MKMLLMFRVMFFYIAQHSQVGFSFTIIAECYYKYLENACVLVRKNILIQK